MGFVVAVAEKAGICDGKIGFGKFRNGWPADTFNVTFTVKDPFTELEPAMLMVP